MNPNTYPKISFPAPALQFLGFTQDGKRVFDRFQSHHSLSKDLIRESLGRVTLRARHFLEVLVRFDRVVGLTRCVTTGPDDRVIYARRKKRNGMSRIVLGRNPEPCSTVFIVLKQNGDDPAAYTMITGFVGDRPAPEPWDRNATSASLPFWQRHGLIVHQDEIVQGTEIEEASLGSGRTWPCLPVTGHNFERFDR
ncbi:MAG TPA: hypothetical protein PKJ41_17000 [Bryobacteraceae bacterium]|nr:hypothetical protein [Bryobacteraceae bacterium]